MRMYVAPSFFSKGASLTNRQIKTIARAAAQAAIRPMQRNLKAIMKVTRSPGVHSLNGQLRSQIQSTGASDRSISSKTGTSRKGGVYAIVAPDLKYVEHHMMNAPLYRAHAQRRGRNVGTTRTGGRNRQRFMYVKSYSTRSIRRPLKRRPGKYWHIINNGFRHRSGTIFMGYGFVPKAILLSRNQAIDAFTRIWSNGVDKLIYGTDPGFKD
jgi:hypothetical protein